MVSPANIACCGTSPQDGHDLQRSSKRTGVAFPWWSWQCSWPARAAVGGRWGCIFR